MNTPSTASRLVEIAAFAILLGALGFMMALPSPDLPSNSVEDLDLHDRVALLRAATFRFEMDHQADGQLIRVSNQPALFVDQLTGRTRLDGTGDMLTGSFDDRWFGPYLERIPVNPINGLNTIRCMPEGITVAVLTGEAGWVYVPSTGELLADLPGEDSRGVAYAEY